ncbi:thymidylate synthase, flavin-dependent [Candidatus Wolfebacteria bacterium RIFCSPLOWO2_01_FULL_38_11]|uniref:FAD-dependent thymidylate synthase n=1 Tax=Candidatus Wolfebacteria bacterium RIFCSPLOWO2_01_FULL_38_11 TaxID=1802556 RepID=A0A1F8DTI9_9BACT|nr:MAG: thymidylate synthase, flavin-dependent [Candidatus Wolfebacteria bacterium RIFCSPLOWO2_01_FULL_38_11]
MLGYSIGINGENQIQLIETAGRTCYKSHDKITDDSAVRFVKKLRDIGHESVIEHSWVAVRFTGCSRAFTHQLVRHRLMAISQESQRYCDEKGFYKNDYFVIPPSIEESGLSDWYCDKLKQIDDWYQELQVKLKEAIKAGKTRGKVNEDARFILPNAVCSEIVISCNFREWRHIFKMRTDIYAQWEIRYVMVDLLRQFQKLFPVVFDDFEISDDGRSAGKITK